MDDLLSEKEQLEQFRAWWKEYGAYVIGGIVVGAGLLFGINHYQDSRLQAQIDASAAFENLVMEVAGGNVEPAETITAEIQTAYAQTSYAGQSGLVMARLYMDKNRDQDAADALSAVIDGDADEQLKSVARLRLARVLLYQDKAEELIDLLADHDNAAFAANYAELRGDAYTALGRIGDAEAAYQAAMLDPLSQQTLDQQLLQWKTLDLPEVEEQTTAEAAEPEAGEAVETVDPDAEVVE